MLQTSTHELNQVQDSSPLPPQDVEDAELASELRLAVGAFPPGRLRHSACTASRSVATRRSPSR